MAIYVALVSSLLVAHLCVKLSRGGGDVICAEEAKGIV